MASLDTISVSGASLQSFTYTAGVPAGFFQGVSYGTYIGPLAQQEFSYDLVDMSFAATLLEDSDGIVAAGSGTCDVTPTAIWTAATDSPPYLYFWVLRNTNVSGSVIASGTTVNVNSATMPVLSPGVYYLAITALDSTGLLVGITNLIFRVLDCKFSLPPTVVSIDPFDIEPVIPTDQDYIRYFPQWMAVHGTATEPPSASSTFKFIQPSLTEIRRVEKECNNFSRESGVLSVPVGLPRKAWHIQTRFSSRDVITVTCVASGITNILRRETSLFNFLDTDDPVYIVGENGHIAFRNLAQREVTVAPVSGSTGATGSVLQFLSHQYQMPAEHEGIVADSNVLFFFDGIQYRIKAGSNGVDPLQAVVQLTDPFSGTIRFKYQSETLAPVVTISISGNPFLSPSPTDLWNRFDELGLVCGLQRRKDEDNLIFRKRIYSRFISTPGTSERKVAQHISQDLTLVSVLPWDGVSTLNLQVSGYFGVKYFEVDGLPETDFLAEELVRYGSSYRIYSGTKSSWLPGWQVYVNGRPATARQYPNIIVSGNIVNFGIDVSGTITASYGFDNFDLTKSSNSTIITVTPVSTNPISGQYTAILSRNVTLHTAADPNYLRTGLLNPNGTPNGLYYEVARRLLESSPIHFGRAKWGIEARWLERSEDKPLTEHLSSVLDIGIP